jgi:hypothetical protein
MLLNAYGTLQKLHMAPRCMRCLWCPVSHPGNSARSLHTAAFAASAGWRRSGRTGGKTTHLVGRGAGWGACALVLGARVPARGVLVCFIGSILHRTSLFFDLRIEREARHGVP